MLFLIATPIGNLKDITLRALETLAACDYLLCEDTRHTRVLLNHYDIKTPLKSFHRFNEKNRQSAILEDLLEGKKIGLVSDAGTPGISDPGELLVETCRLQNIPVTPIPGPCAAIAAISASGLKTGRFQFFGFLPRKKGKLKKILEETLSFPGTTICYESPFRIAPTLKAIIELDPQRKCALAREITKKFETFLSGSAQELLVELQAKPPKGEFVLLISGIEL